jgi:hypothetical protein
LNHLILFGQKALFLHLRVKSSIYWQIFEVLNYFLLLDFVFSVEETSPFLLCFLRSSLSGTEQFTDGDQCVGVCAPSALLAQHQAGACPRTPSD